MNGNLRAGKMRTVLSPIKVKSSLHTGIKIQQGGHYHSTKASGKQTSVSFLHTMRTNKEFNQSRNTHERKKLCNYAICIVA